MINLLLPVSEADGSPSLRLCGSNRSPRGAGPRVRRGQVADAPTHPRSRPAGPAHARTHAHARRGTRTHARRGTRTHAPTFTCCGASAHTLHARVTGGHYSSHAQAHAHHDARTRTLAHCRRRTRRGGTHRDARVRARECAARAPAHARVHRAHPHMHGSMAGRRHGRARYWSKRPGPGPGPGRHGPGGSQ